MVGKAQQQEHSQVQQRQVLMPGSFLLCIPPGTPARGMVRPTSRMGLSYSVNLSRCSLVGMSTGVFSSES